MGVSDDSPSADPHRRHSMLLVPMDSPGLVVVRNMPIMQHRSIDGHCEMLFRNVRVPAANLLGEEGAGFAMAQARLGPGRVHHCMRSIGQCELALELLCDRALERKAFGSHLAGFANIRDWIAHSRIEIDQARLLVLRAAWLMDRHGNAAARTEVSAIKVVAAQLQTRVVDRAMQVFGAMGLAPDTPLAYLWTWGRATALPRRPRRGAPGRGGEARIGACARAARHDGRLSGAAASAGRREDPALIHRGGATARR